MYSRLELTLRQHLSHFRLNGDILLLGTTLSGMCVKSAGFLPLPSMLPAAPPSPLSDRPQKEIENRILGLDNQFQRPNKRQPCWCSKQPRSSPYSSSRKSRRNRSNKSR